MPKRVYNNVVGSRIIDNGRVVEDVTQFSPPTIKHPVTSMQNVSGMAADVDIPDTTHVEAMEVSFKHNNGVNCRYLMDPGKHDIEGRFVRQSYNTAGAEIEHESVKFRMIGMHVENSKSELENGSPYGSTDKFSLLRYEEEINGNVVLLIDAMAGKITVNGRDYTSTIENLLK